MQGQGDYASTRELFMDMTSKGIAPSRSHFNALIVSCAKDGLAETARAVFEMLPHYDILPEVDTWTALMSCHRKDLEQCKRILDEMLQAGVSPSLSRLCKDPSKRTGRATRRSPFMSLGGPAFHPLKLALRSIRNDIPRASGCARPRR